MASASSDPDNVRDGDARIVYELKSLVVMGQCYDVVDSRPPNGLQIQLEGTQSDTLVMQNLGYFQLKGSPGSFQLDIVNGRSSELYDIHGGKGLQQVSLDVCCPLSCICF